MTTKQKTYTCLLETGNERLFAIARKAAGAVEGYATYIVRDEETSEVTFHFDIIGEHKRGVLSKDQLRILTDVALVSRLVGEVRG
jgi:hypothetical protein